MTGDLEQTMEHIGVAVVALSNAQRTCPAELYWYSSKLYFMLRELEQIHERLETETEA